MPAQISNYQLSLKLYKFNNGDSMSKEWSYLNEQTILGWRQTKFLIIENNPTKNGLYSLVNKFHILTNKINLCDLNMSIGCFKNLMTFF